MRFLRRWARVSLLIPALLVAAGAPSPRALAQTGAAGVTAAAPVPAGEPFPAWTYTNLNDGAGGPPKIDLAAVLGKKPVVFCYWIAGLSRSERVFLDLQGLVNEIGAGKIALIGIAKPFGGSSDVLPIRQRIQALKIQGPVLLDDTFRLGQQLLVQTVPSVSVVDASGKLRLTNGGSLLQTLEYKMTLEGALRRMASTGQMGTYGALPRYDPVVELIGKKSPDFEAASLDDGITRRWSSLMASDKVNVLVFWSVTCPHCQKELPKLNTWLQAHKDGINLVTAARIDNDQMKAKTQEFCRLSAFSFPTLADPTFRIADLFNVNATPTILVIRPDGVIDSVVPAGEETFAAFLEEKKKTLLKQPKS